MNAQIDLLKSSGLKVTLPRLKVLEIFESSPHSHLSAEDVYKQLLVNGGDVGIATVYRILMQFVDAGMLRKSTFGGEKAVFELNQGHPHDHMVCVHCSKVVEFFNPTIAQEQDAIAAANGFQLLERTMALYGVCDAPDCRRKAR